MTKKKFQLALLPLALASTLALGACSGSDDPAPAPSSSSSSTTQSTEPAASIPSLTGVSTSVALDSNFVAALGTLGLTPAPVGSATISAEGVASFPITGGNVDYYGPDSPVRPYVQGEIDHDGSGLSLTSADGTVVELTDFKIDPGDPAQLTGTVSANGTVAAEDAVLFDLNGRTLQPIIMNDDGTATLTGTEVLLNSGAADLLNQTFKTDALKGDLLIGISTITINTK